MQIASKIYTKKIELTVRERVFRILCNTFRVLAVLLIISAFIVDLNPSRILVGPDGITASLSLFTSGFTGTINRNLRHLFGRRFGAIYTPGAISSNSVLLLRLSSVVIFLGIIAIALGTCMTLAGKRIKQLGGWLPIGGSVLMLIGLAGVLIAYSQVSNSQDSRVVPNIPFGFYVFLIAAFIALFLAIVNRVVMPKDREAATNTNFKIPKKYKLFLYVIPVLILTFLIAYLPLWGWRYAFFDVPITGEVSRSNFVGLRWFREIFTNPASRQDMLWVMRNTLIMSGLGIASSILPVLFAMFFAEVKSRNLGRFVQTFATLPNFVSWVLIYAFAFTIFSTNGVFNNIFGGSTDHLMTSGPAVWMQMLGWGVWRSLGWSAIIYIAAISGIDQEMYEAASIDGAKRFGKMWHITFPSLMPTFSVMLLLAFAGMLSNGLEQYFVFANAFNRDHIRVLDLYVFQIGLGVGGEANIGLATVIGMLRTAISLVLLLIANYVSKFIRGESII